MEFPYEHTIDYANIPPILATINNIISRGLPTKAPIVIEEIFANIGLTQKTDNEFILEYSKSVKELSFENIFADTMGPIWSYGKEDRMIQKELSLLIPQLQRIEDFQVLRLMLNDVDTAYKKQLV